MPRTHNIPALITCRKAKRPVQHGRGTCGKSHWGSCTLASYLPTTLHSLMDLLQEVSLPTALGVTDGGGVGGLCDE